MYEALHDLNAFQAMQRPDHTALVYKAERLSYGAAWHQTESLAAGLSSLGHPRSFGPCTISLPGDRPGPRSAPRRELSSNGNAVGTPALPSMILFITNCSSHRPPPIFGRVASDTSPYEYQGRNAPIEPAEAWRKKAMPGMEMSLKERKSGPLRAEPLEANTEKSA